MTWTKLADGLPRHPKIVGLSDAAFRLHIYALCYASEQLTDGEIPEAALPTLAPRRARKLVEELVFAGLWHDETHECDACPPLVRGLYYLHGFLEYNPPAEKVETERAAARERMQRARRSKRSGEQPPNVLENNGRSSAAERSPSPSRPVPSRDDNSSLQESHADHPQPVDDDDQFRPAATKVRATIERMADQRMENRNGIRDRGSYRASVLAELEQLHLDQLCTLVHQHPDATIDQLIGTLNAEPTTLGMYPRAIA